VSGNIHHISMKIKSPVFIPLIVLFLILVLGILVFDARPVFTEQFDGKGYFRKGKLELDKGRADDAVRSLLIAQKEFPLLGDYASLYLADAYHKLGDHARALDAVKGLLATYPQSPLVKRARAAEIREAKEAADGSAGKLYEHYTRDYPDDEDMLMAYGLYLKNHGEGPKAAVLFRGLYVRGGQLSSAALAELDSREIRVADLLERAMNLMRRYDFRDAEKDLRKALQMDDGRKREEILRNLGQALFRQKEYREAAAVYEKANDLYSKSRSLYRAGDKDGFQKSLTVLLERNDKKAGGLLVAAACDRRRAGDYNEAIKIYTDAAARFPSEEEDALWGSGWTWFVSGEFRKAADLFHRLAKKYDDPKYLYWQARSIEALGEDASGLYNSLSRINNNFYSFMAQLRTTKRITPASYTESAAEAPSSHSRKRVEALIELGLPREAVIELTFMARTSESQPGILYAVSKFYELGEFKRAVSLATKLPYSERLHRLWYPLAFWDEVSSVTRRYDFDPLIALSVMREESRFDADARSVAGARGLMQIMPQTAYRLDKTLRLGIHKDSQINDVRSNISLGVYYLKSLSSEFRSVAHALAAYNAGEAAVRRWEQEGGRRNVDEFIEDIPYAETRNYVKKVLTSYFQYSKASSSGAGDSVLGKL